MPRRIGALRQIDEIRCQQQPMPPHAAKFHHLPEGPDSARHYLCVNFRMRLRLDRSDMPFRLCRRHTARSFNRWELTLSDEIFRRLPLR